MQTSRESRHYYTHRFDVLCALVVARLEIVELNQGSECLSCKLYRGGDGRKAAHTRTSMLGSLTDAPNDNNSLLGYNVSKK